MPYLCPRRLCAGVASVGAQRGKAYDFLEEVSETRLRPEEDSQMRPSPPCRALIPCAPWPSAWPYATLAE